MDPIEQQTESPAAERARATRPSLLSLLVEDGIASEGELRLIAVEGMGGGVRLGEALLQRGWIDEAGLGRLLARQWSLPFVEEGSMDLISAADDALSRERAHELRALLAGRRRLPPGARLRPLDRSTERPARGARRRHLRGDHRP